MVNKEQRKAIKELNLNTNLDVYTLMPKLWKDFRKNGTKDEVSFTKLIEISNIDTKEKIVLMDAKIEKYTKYPDETKLKQATLFKEIYEEDLLDPTDETTIQILKKKLERDTFRIKDVWEVTDTSIKRIKYGPAEVEFKTSGRIIVENDIREFYNEVDGDIEKAKGLTDVTKGYAKQGLLHGFVGNSCPTLYIDESKTSIQFGSEWDDEKYDVIIPEGYSELASVCTDLWWYCICDAETFFKNNPDEKEKDYTIVDIKPGIWKLKHMYGISSTGYHEIPYATMEWISE